MSGKTKAELLAENAALKAENKRLERNIEILTQNVRGFLYDSDRAERDSKIVKAAHDGTITKYINKHNELGGVLENQGKGRSEKARKAKERIGYIKQKFAQFLADGIPEDKARRKANNATAEKFGKGYGKSALYEHCPASSADR